MGTKQLHNQLEPHQLVLVGPGTSTPEREVGGSSHCPILVSSASPHKQTTWKTRQVPRDTSKERQVSKRVKQRATNLFTYNVSKGGHPSETSHSTSLNSPAAPLKENDLPSFPSAAKAEPRAQTKPCSLGAPASARRCFELVLLLLFIILHTWTQRSHQLPRASPLERISTPHSEGKHWLLIPHEPGCHKQTGTELITNRIRINCFKLTFRSKRTPLPLWGQSAGLWANLTAAASCPKHAVFALYQPAVLLP